MSDTRKGERKKIVITTVIRKAKPEGGYAILEFRSRDLSEGGIFIFTENLSLFDLGEEVELLVDVNEQKYYEGQGKVVRSAKDFTEEGRQLESGYGIMFIDPDDSFKGMLSETLKEK